MSVTAEFPASELSPIEDVIEEARQGRMFILVDAEDRENEGDLVIPAQMCTPDVINFMTKHGRGLVCMPLTGERARQLNLELMARSNRSRHRTAFTVSIEAREGISTGISAHDRARTISVAIDPTKGAEDVVSPGHIFPLVARDGGVLVRAGHTEAAVDIARLAGLYPAGVICEVMKDDGSMARLPDLIEFAKEHKLKVGTIEDLIRYRRRHDHFLERAMERDFDTFATGRWDLKLYTNKVEYAEHIALVKGEISPNEPVLVRMHKVNVFEDLLGGVGKGTGVLARSMELINSVGKGVVVLIRDTKPTVVSELLKSTDKDGGEGDGVPGQGALGDGVPGESASGTGATGTGAPGTGTTDGEPRLREYGVGAQILLDLGVRSMILLSNTPRKIVGLDGYGLRVIEHVRVPALTAVQS